VLANIHQIQHPVPNVGRKARYRPVEIVARFAVADRVDALERNLTGAVPTLYGRNVVIAGVQVGEVFPNVANVIFAIGELIR
jgi:hypothetical protein